MLKIVDECLDLCYKFNKYERYMVIVDCRFHLVKNRIKKTFVFFGGHMEGERDGEQLSDPETF